MRKVVYLVGGQEITSYAKAREIQPTGQLKVRLDKITEEGNQEKIAKHRAAVQCRQQIKISTI